MGIWVNGSSVDVKIGGWMNDGWVNEWFVEWVVG